MYIIEPCCAVRQLMLLRDAIGKNGTMDFEGYGDLSLTELMPALLTRYADTEMTIVAPTVPDQAAEIIEWWMKWQWSRSDGKGKVNVIKHLTIITNLNKRKSPVVSEWLKDNPFGERLTLIDKQQSDTAILLPDFAITGPVNLRYGNNFVATATSNPERIAELWNMYVKEGKSGKETTEPDSEAEESAAEVASVSDVPANNNEPEPAEEAVLDE